MVAVSTDFYYCLYCPALTLYACPAVRRNFRLLQVDIGFHWFSSNTRAGNAGPQSLKFPNLGESPYPTRKGY